MPSSLPGPWVFGGLPSWNECGFHFWSVWSRAWLQPQSVCVRDVTLSVEEILPYFIIYQVFRKQILKYSFSLKKTLVSASKIGAGNVAVWILFLAKIIGITFLLFMFKVKIIKS